MKILSISSDRADAHTAASALQMAGLNADVSTATGLREAAHWIFNNLDVAAIILDGQFGATSCAAFLQHLRRRCLTVPAILVVMDHSGSGVDRFGLGPHDRVVMKTTLTEDLGPVVQRAVGAGCMEGTNVDRLFDVHPLPLCRSSHDGVVTRANRAFATLFGCPSATEKRTLELASELFNSSQELAWLTGRTVSPGASASIECTRRKVDGSRLVLRLSAVANTDAIHIVVEDLTSNWLLQERLARPAAESRLNRCAGRERDPTCDRSQRPRRYRPNCLTGTSQLVAVHASMLLAPAASASAERIDVLRRSVPRISLACCGENPSFNTSVC